jgi:Lrp/AsnC family transcriptional regulator, regulator for asnA, asnC and gidA
LGKVDDIDLRIIRCLQDDPRAPYATVARLTGVSETTVKRRVDDLIARRIIRPAMIANIYRLGYRTRATIGLKVELKHMVAVAEALRALPETAYVAFTSGEYNVTCLVAVQSLEALTRFMLEEIAPIEGITETQVMVVPRILKSFADWRVPTALQPEPDDAAIEDDALTTVAESEASAARDE